MRNPPTVAQQHNAFFNECLTAHLIEKLISKQAKSNERDDARRVNELLLDARCHSKHRNSLIHRFFGKADDGVWQTSGDGSYWEDLPAIEVIDDLVRSIQKTTDELNAERFGRGFIAELSQRCV